MVDRPIQLLAMARSIDELWIHDTARHEKLMNCRVQRSDLCEDIDDFVFATSGDTGADCERAQYVAATSPKNLIGVLEGYVALRDKIEALAKELEREAKDLREDTLTSIAQDARNDAVASKMEKVAASLWKML